MKPHPWQESGARWLAGRRRALLADGMRVGKCGTSIVAADMIGAGSILVTCPGIARENWAREFDRFSLVGRPVSVVMSPRDPIEPGGVTILSVDGSRSADIHARVMQHEWDLLLVDEAQNLKEPGSSRTKMVLSAHGFAARAARIWFLTGTPMLNHPAELWIMLRTIGRWRDGYSAFLDRFAEWFPGEFGPVVKAMKNVDELRALLAPVMLRRTWREVSPESPAPEWLEVRLDPDEVEEESACVLAFLEQQGDLRARVRRLVQQIAAGGADARGDAQMALLRSATAIAKAGPVARWIERQMAAGMSKLVVFAHHRTMIDHLVRALAPFGAAGLHGDLAMAKRQAVIDGFTTDPGRRVLVCQDQIARTAIDLTAAADLLFAEMDWVPDNNAQAAMRVQGPRQTKPVRIWTASLPNSSDAALAKVIAKKSRMSAELFG